MIKNPKIVTTTVTEYPHGFRPTYTLAQAYLENGSSHSLNGLHIVGLGAHETESLAQALACSEAVERLATADIAMDRLSFGSFNAHPQRVDPRPLLSLTTAQAQAMQLKPFAPQQDYYWMEGREVLTNTLVQLIADVCGDFSIGRYPQRFSWMTSSGVAAHPDINAARDSALLELFERDALMMTWMERHVAPHIPRRRLPPRAQQSVENIQQHGYQCHALDITCRAVPVVMAIAHRPSWPALIVTMAARLSLQDASIAAWKELEAEVYWRPLEQIASQTSEIPCEKVVSPEDHGHFYSAPRNIEQAAFLWSSRQETKRDIDEPVFGESSCDLRDLAMRCGLDRLYEVQYGALVGREVVRLLTPNVVPLTFGVHQLPLKHPARRINCSLSGTKLYWPSTVIPPHPFV